MHIEPLHRWDLTQAEAVTLQSILAARVDTSTPLGDYELIAGADVSNDRFSNTVFAGVVLFAARGETLEVVEKRGAVAETTFPYVPGLLSFREAPVLLQAFARLEKTPDVVILDGQGIAHPRGLGIASHMGLWLNVPCVGCAKSRLWGTFRELDRKAGATAPLTYKAEVIGRVVRSRTSAGPLFISPGHRIDLESAVRVVLSSCKGYRLPEPTRQAHNYVNALRRGDLPC
ncbi:MAG TPA: deoxyribonuclease V [Gemmataceae bacterium]|nr:deoxyribonuclease V [Gemmataceae bacterium]